MAQLRQDYALFVARDVEVVVVGPEDAAAFAAYWQKESLPFVGLPDPTHSVLKLYGQEINLFKLGRMPAQVKKTPLAASLYWEPTTPSAVSQPPTGTSLPGIPAMRSGSPAPARRAR